MYKKIENNIDDAYLHNITTIKVIECEQEANYNMQMVCYIDKEENADKDNLFDKRGFKSISTNATKQLRVQQET